MLKWFNLKYFVLFPLTYGEMTLFTPSPGQYCLVQQKDFYEHLGQIYSLPWYVMSILSS